MILLQSRCSGKNLRIINGEVEGLGGQGVHGECLVSRDIIAISEAIIIKSLIWYPNIQCTIELLVCCRWVFVLANWEGTVGSIGRFSTGWLRF